MTDRALPPVALVISDVDGTLTDPRKEVTPRAREAIRRLTGAGIVFTVVSGRPPFGLTWLREDLGLTAPFAAFNGGALVDGEGRVVGTHLLPPACAQRAIAALDAAGVDAWVYTERDWVVRDVGRPHVARETRTVRRDPVVATDLAAYVDRAAKVVAVSDDPAALARAEAAVCEAVGAAATVARSQPYYVDVTHPKANKGEVVDALVRMLGVRREAIATIGDMPSDVRMFVKSGLPIAMGQAPDDVKGAARFVTASNAEEGFAKAMERWILGDGGAGG